jgi:orotidine-5'-phosphate decarboxylase
MTAAARPLSHTHAQILPAKERLIVALDVPTVAQARKITEALGDNVSFYKIGAILLLADGLFSFARELKNKGKKIFLDCKFLDIPDTVREVVRVASKLKIDFITVHGERKNIEAAVEGRRGNHLKILVVTLLTSYTEKAFQEEFHTKIKLKRFVLERATLASKLGCDGVITSAQEIADIRRALPNDFLIVTPGIRPVWTTENYHNRRGTPREAILRGSDYLVIGRPIINFPGKKYAEAVQRIIDEIEEALTERAASSGRVASIRRNQRSGGSASPAPTPGQPVTRSARADDPRAKLPLARTG